MRTTVRDVIIRYFFATEGHKTVDALLQNCENAYYTQVFRPRLHRNLFSNRRKQFSAIPGRQHEANKSLSIPYTTMTPLGHIDWQSVLDFQVESATARAQRLAAEEQEATQAKDEQTNASNPTETTRVNALDDMNASPRVTKDSTQMSPVSSPCMTPSSTPFTAPLPESEYKPPYYCATCLDPNRYTPAAYEKYRFDLDKKLSSLKISSRTLPNGFEAWRAWHTTPPIPFRREVAPFLCECRYRHCFGVCTIAQEKWWGKIPWLMEIRTSDNPIKMVQEMPTKTAEELWKYNLAVEMLGELKETERAALKDGGAGEGHIKLALTAVFNK